MSTTIYDEMWEDFSSLQQWLESRVLYNKYNYIRKTWDSAGLCMMPELPA